MKISIKPSFIIYSIVAVGITIIAVIYYRHEKFCEKNVLNCQKISIGMSIETVTQIMGEPRDIIALAMEVNGELVNAEQYCYDAPADAKKGVYVYIDAVAKNVLLTECKE